MLGRIKRGIQYYLLGGKRRHEAFLRQREINQQHRYDYPSENNGWKKVGDSPVWGDSTTGTMFDPQVLVNEGRLLMTVSARKTDTILLLSSDDGISWKQESVLLTPIRKTWEHKVNRSCLLFVDGRWHLWYTGQNRGKSCIGHVISYDGMSFVRPKDNMPVLCPTLPIEGASVMNPCVIWDEKIARFRMWYAAGEAYEPDVLMYAESVDGNSWDKHPIPVLAKEPLHPWEQCKVGGCDVMRQEDGILVMHYIGYQNVDVARICFATSSDGIHWERMDNNFCLSPSLDAWDADAVYKPTLVLWKGKQYLWYNGRRGNKEYVGMAKNVRG